MNESGWNLSDWIAEWNEETTYIFKIKHILLKKCCVLKYAIKSSGLKLVSSSVLGLWISWKILRISSLYSIPDTMVFSDGLNHHSPLHISLIFYTLTSFCHLPYDFFSLQPRLLSDQTGSFLELDPLPLLCQLVTFWFFLSLSSIFCVSSPLLNKITFAKILEICIFIFIRLELGPSLLLA